MGTSCFYAFRLRKSRSKHLDHLPSSSKKPPSCSPRSIGNSEFLNPITHEVILSDSRCELKITGFGGFQDTVTNNDANGGGGGTGGGGGSTFVGTLRPGTPGPGGHPTMHYFNNHSLRNNVNSSSKTRTNADMVNMEKRRFDSLESWSMILDSENVETWEVSKEDQEEWTADLFQLFIGNKFASGAHSRIYRGIYKQRAVAVKMVRIPNHQQETRSKLL